MITIKSTPEQRLEALRNIEFFKELEEKYLLLIAERSVLQRFGEVKVLFEEGDRGDAMYVVLSGVLLVEQSYYAGNPGNAARRGAGAVVGEMALLDGSPRMATARELEECSLLVVSAEDFSTALRGSPEFAKAIIANLTNRLRLAWDKNRELQTQQLRFRVINKLIEVAEMQIRESNSAPLTLNIQSRDFGELIGTNEQSLSRHFGFLEEVGVIQKTRGKVRILDLDALKNLLASPKP